MHSSRRPTTALIAFLLLLAGWNSTAIAQLPPDVYTTPRSLTAEQSLALQAFVQKNVDGLKSTDSRALAESRRSLLTPSRQDTSRTFRMAYNDALTPRLAELIGDETVPMANRQAAIWILGSIASDESDAALKEAMSAAHPSFRYAAATSLERSMQAIRQDRQTYSNPLQSEKNVARFLRDALSAESDAEVMRAMVSAAAAMPTAANAIDTIGEALTAQAHRLKDEGETACLDSIRIGLERMQKRYVVDLFGGKDIAIHERKMIEAATSALLLVADHAAATKITAESREIYANLAHTCENLLNLLCKRDGTQTRVFNAIEAGRYDDVSTVLKANWLAADGPIYGNRVWEIPAGSIEVAFDR